MNLYNLGLSGLSASQIGLQVASHNIDNAATPNYTLQKAMLSTAGATATSEGFIGRGVEVTTVNREYNDFLFRRLINAEGETSQFSKLYQGLATVNSLFSEEVGSIGPSLSNFFASVNAAASSPADLVWRQNLIGKGQALVAQVKTTASELQNQRTEINSQITGMVQQINGYLNQINDFNQKIVLARATGHAPNDLLDQRNEALQQLSKLVGVNFYEQDGSLNVMLIGGQTLLSGKTVYSLAAVKSAADPQRTAVAYSLPSGPGGAMLSVELDDTELTAGALSGLLGFRTSLNAVQDRLGQFAVGLSLSFNRQHKQGLDLERLAGTNFFEVTAPAAIAHAQNTSGAVLQSEYLDSEFIKATSYKIVFDGANYSVTRLADNSLAYSGPAAGMPPAMDFDGLRVSLTSGTPNAGESWLLEPMRNAAVQFKQVLTAPLKVALADNLPHPGGLPGSSNGNNGLLLAKVQTDDVFGNNLSLNGQFAQLFNYVGLQTQQAKTAFTAQKDFLKQTNDTVKSNSGVNLDEEYTRLQLYQQQYFASAKIIEVASTIFNAILGLRT